MIDAYWYWLMPLLMLIYANLCSFVPIYADL